MPLSDAEILNLTPSEIGELIEKLKELKKLTKENLRGNLDDEKNNTPIEELSNEEQNLLQEITSDTLKSFYGERSWKDDATKNGEEGLKLYQNRYWANNWTKDWSPEDDLPFKDPILPDFFEKNQLQTIGDLENHFIRSILTFINKKRHQKSKLLHRNYDSLYRLIGNLRKLSSKYLKSQTKTAVLNTIDRLTTHMENVWKATNKEER